MPELHLQHPAAPAEPPLYTYPSRALGIYLEQGDGMAGAGLLMAPQTTFRLADRPPS